MAFGPGKYDDQCTFIRESTNADAVLLIVLNGNKGDGFSVQITNPAISLHIPRLLEETAKQIREDMSGKTNV